MSDSGTVAAPARQKSAKPLRKEARAGAYVDRKGGDSPFFASSPAHLQEGEGGAEVRAFFSGGFAGTVMRRGRHEGDDDLQRKCEECEAEEVQRKEAEEEVQRKCEECDGEVQRKEKTEEVQRKEEAKPDEVQRKCAACEAEVKRSPGPGAAESSKAPVGGGGQPMAHARLTVGAPDDPYEKEADQMGEKVKAMSFEGPISAAAINPAASGVQRSEEEATEEIQAKPASGLRRAQAGGLQTNEDFGARLQSSGGGNPIPAPVQQHMESAFRADFSAVRIHTGVEAASLSEEIGAQAFTYQNHIFFNERKFNPASSEGRFLLAHELTHTVQQGVAPTVRRDEGDAPPPTKEESFLDKLKNGFDTVLSAVLPTAIYNMFKAIQKDGVVGYIKSLLLSLFHGLFSKLGFSDKEILLIFEIFSQLKDQLPTILAALESGDCKPLFKALDLLSQVLSAIAGRVWDRLMEAIEPIRQWLLDIWDTVLSPALDEVKAFAGDVWDEIKNFGKWIWEKFQPVIQKGKDAWAWVMRKLGFGDDPSEEGLFGFISRKLGEAWESVKTLLKPVTEPIGKMLDGIKSIVSLDAIRKFQDDAKKWLDEVAKTATAMGNEDDAVKNKQLTLREVLLPALNKAIDRLKQTIREAGTWVMGNVTAIRDNVNGMVTGIQSNKYVSALSSVVTWVPKTVDKIYDWASDKVDFIFGKIIDGVESLRQFIDPVLKGLVKIVDVASDLLGKLPDFVTGGLYGKIPKCIKDPIIDWITENILKNIPIISQMIDLKDKWPQIRATALTVLKQVFVDGNFRAALWTFFRNLLSLLGIDPTLVTTIIAKAAKNFSDIISNPLSFLKNVWAVIKGGFKLFWDNIGTHLLQGALDWLFGEVKGVSGVAAPPKPYTLAGVLGYVLQLFGVNEANVFDRMVKNKKIGEKKAAKLREAWEMIKTAVDWFVVWLKEGPEGLLKKAKGKLSGIMDAVISGVISWVSEKLTAKILEKLATSSDPLGIGATINVLIVVYDAMQAAVDYANKILNIANAAMDGLAEIIAGNLGPAITAFRDLLVKSLPVVIGFTVQVIIGKVGAKIKEIVEGVQNTVNDAIDWLINGVIGIIEGIIDTVGKGVDKVKGWLGLTKEFTADNGESHTLSFKGTEQRSALMIASDNPMDYEKWVNGLPSAQKKDTNLQKKKGDALKKAQEIGRVEKKATTTKYTAQDKQKELNKLLLELSNLSKPLFGLKSGKPVFGPAYPGSGWGTWMEVEGLTKSGTSGGSEPSVSGPVYNVINQRRFGGGSYYVRGHLLNMKLGGTGADWQNLTPITGKANADHVNIVESKVKDAVEAGNSVNYRVDAEYKRPDERKALAQRVAAAKAAELKADPDVIGKIIEQEFFVPSRLLCTATMKDPKKNNAESALFAKNTVIQNTLDQTPGAYTLVAEKIEPVYLSDGAAEIQKINGINGPFADRIAQAYTDHGSFSTEDSLVDYAVDGKPWFTAARQQTLREVLKKPYVKLYHGK